MSQQLTNFAISQLNGSVDASVTTITVDTGSLFPSTGDFYVRVEDEIMKCTARSGNDLTVVRGQEGTTAASHADNSLIKLPLTKGAFEDYFGERVQIGGYASRPATAKDGTRYFATDFDYGWLYEGGWSVIHPTYSHYSRAMDLTGWTGVNLGSSTWTVTNGILQIGMPQNSGEGLRGYYRTAPSTPYSINLLVKDTSVSPQYNSIGLSLTNTGTSHKLLSYLSMSSRGAISIDRYASTTSWSSTTYRQNVWLSSAIWLKIRDDGTNVKYYFSQNGIDYIELASEARTTFFTHNSAAIICNRSENTSNIPTVWHNGIAYWEGS